MATRSVSKYLQLERSLQDSLANRDRSAVTPLLAEDFEARSAASADAVDADAWLRQEFASAAHNPVVRDLSVREFDDLAIVSFLLDGVSGSGGGKMRATAKTQFVVDVWRQSTGKLLVRYRDRSASAPPPPTRPTGRE